MQETFTRWSVDERSASRPCSALPPFRVPGYTRNSDARVWIDSKKSESYPEGEIWKDLSDPPEFRCFLDLRIGRDPVTWTARVK